MRLKIGEEVLYSDGGDRRKRCKVVAVPAPRCVTLEFTDGTCTIVQLDDVEVAREPRPRKRGGKRRKKKSARKGASIHVIYVPQGGQPR